MEKHRSPTIYKTYIICIALLLICFIGALVLRERESIVINLSRWNPDIISVQELGFTGERFMTPGTINKQTIIFGRQKYLVIFTYSLDTKGSGMFIYGPNALGQTQLKGVLILSNGADEMMISKVPNIIETTDINMDNNPEFVIDIGSYMDTDFYEQYTIITYNNNDQKLIWNGLIDKDPDTEELIDKGHNMFINGETEMSNMNFEINTQDHTIKVYQGIKSETEDGEWIWKSVFYELLNNKFIFKTTE